MEGIIATYHIDLHKMKFFLSGKGKKENVTICGTKKTVHPLNKNKIDCLLKITLITDNSDGVYSRTIEDIDYFFFNKVKIELTDKSFKHETRLKSDTHHTLNYYNKEIYAPVIIETIDDILLYFKYKLKNNISNSLTLNDIKSIEDSLFNPDITNLKGNQLSIFITENASGFIVLNGFEYLQTKKLSIKHFESNLKSELTENIFAKNDGYPLVDQILSDAQSAAFEGKTPRAILELALAVEVFVKQAYFSRDTISSLTFDFLEGNNGSTSVIDLINKAAVIVFGEKFSASNRDDNLNIIKLFELRNKIAHTGVAKYRDHKDSNQFITANEKTLSELWASALTLVDWLNEKIKSRIDPSRNL